MLKQDYTLCDCCGSYEPCKRYWLGVAASHFESDHLATSNLPAAPVNQSEKWLCQACYDPVLVKSGIMPTCVHCGLMLKPSEYRQQLCAIHHNSIAGIDSRAKYNSMRKKTS